MRELIDRAALIAEYDRVHIGPPGGARKLMEDAPTIEERKTGRWVRSITKDLIGYNVTVYTCTECAQISMCISNFCPNCGAKMEETE